MFSVNQLRLGTITATDYCLGSIPVQKMYMGSVLVFDRTPVVETKYTFTVPQPTISLPAQAESGNFTLSWESYKQDVINGEVQEAKTKVGVTTNSLEVPEWIQLSSQEEGELGNSLTFTFSNNTTTDERSFTFQLTQQESSKQLTVVVTQSGAEIETTYTWNVTPTTVTIDGTNTATINVTSYKQQWIGDIQQGSQTPVDFQYTNPGLEETIKANKVDNGNGSWTITLSGGQPSVETTYQMVFTANEGDNSTTVTVNKVVAGRNYGDITITEFTYPDIAPASGSTLTPTLSYTQSWGYGDSTTDGGTITSGATLQFAGGAVNASNGQYTYASKGTTVSSQTNTEVTVTVSMNGKTATAKANASQAANTATYGDITGGAGTATDIPAKGGSVSATVSQNATQTVSFTSGATRAGNVTSSATSVSANTLGTTVKSRTQVGTSTITFTGEGSKTKQVSVPVYQAANAITNTTYNNVTVTVSADPDSISATGGTSTITASATRNKVDTYTSTATNTTQESTTPTLSSSNTAFSLSGTTVTVGKNTGAARSTTITASAYSTEKTCTITQESGQEISSYGDITISGGSVANDIPASGGTVSASGCTATIVVNYSSGESSTISVPSSNITYTSVQASSLGTTEKARTKVGTSTCNVSYQGKTASKQIDVYQEANTRNETPTLNWGNYGNWKADASGRITEGTSNDNKHAAFTFLQLKYTYTSGSTQIVKVEKITLKTDANWIYPTDNSDFTVASRGTVVGEERVGNVWFEYEGRSTTKKTVTQAANTATYANPVVSCTYNDIPAGGGSVNPTSSFTQAVSYTSGSSSSVSTGGTWTYVNATNTSTGQVTASSKGTTESGKTEVKTVTANITINGRTGSKQVVVYQQANTKTAGDIQYGEWQVSVSANPNTIDSNGGVRTITRNATRIRTQQYNYTSGATSSAALSNETGTPTLSSNQTWATVDGNNVTISKNTTASSRTVTITGTYQGKSDTCTITQSAQQVESYGDITISGGSVSGDIPASGGNKSASGCTATIRVNYDNDTYQNVNVPSSNISYSSVSGSNLGTTAKARTKVGTSRCTVNYQGKTATKDFDVYQQANSSTATDIDYGTWQVNVSANPTSIAVGGGTSTITTSASRTRKQNYTWTSGATSQSDMANETATPALSVSGTGFSLAGTTVTATSNIPAKTYTLTASNPTGDLEEGPDQELTSNVTSTYTQPSSNARSCTVTATHSGVSKQVTISQGGQSQGSGVQDWSVAKGTNMQTATESGNTILMVPNPEYGNKNETYTATCTVTQTVSNKTATVTGTWYKGYLNVSPATLEFTADGGTDKITIDTNLNWQVMP